MCVGSESKYFHGHTNFTDGDFLCFGVKGLLETNKRLKDAMLFNILSYMSNQLLSVGNTVSIVVGVLVVGGVITVVILKRRRNI